MTGPSAASAVSAASFDAMWADLQPLGRVASGGYRRFAWTSEDQVLREWFAGESGRRGLDLTEDRAGNQWAWWGDPDAAVAAGRPGIAMGSHLDSVPEGGAFDGPLGVVSAFAVVDALRATGTRPHVPLGVVRYRDEEGARFGVACTGSRVLTGAMAADRALGLRDADGVTMAEAVAAAGVDPDRLGPDPEALRRVGTFVELHVEQGRGLVDLGVPVAVASDIWPHGRWRIELPGRGNHAGTTRLEDRHDALVSLAEVVLAARRLAHRHACLATVGRVAVVPDGVTAVASHATGWLDCRGAHEAGVQALVDDLSTTVTGLGGTVAQHSWTPATRFDPALAQRLRRVIAQSCGHDVPVLATGAGHDAGVLATAGVPTGMLFVRNPTGVSHDPAEHADRADCLAGVDALAACVTDLVRALP